LDKSVQLRAILLGGIAGGLLSAVPGLGMLAFCCCGGFVTLGALGSVYYFVSKSPLPPRDADGMIVGLGSGTLGGTIAGVANSIMQLLTPRDEIMRSLEEMQKLLGFLGPGSQELLQRSIEQSAHQSLAPAVIMSMLMIVALSCLAGSLAGLIGTRLFRSWRRQWPGVPTAPGYYPTAPGAYPVAPGYYGPMPPAATPPGMPSSPPFSRPAPGPPAPAGAAVLDGNAAPSAPPEPAGVPWGPAPKKDGNDAGGTGEMS
jgi:hypothetical protein